MGGVRSVMPNDFFSSAHPWRDALGAAPLHTPPRVLVAEDDDDMRCLIVEALAKDGYDIAEVADGGRLLVALAHEIARDRDDALVVSDIRMPVCTGLEIVEQMRAAQWKMPVVLMTAFGDPKTRERATMLGAVLFDKPFDVDDLRTAVASLLRRRAIHSP
jgi:DNA-binding response OmpR family regulator